MVASCDTETGPEVIDNCPEGGLPLQGSPESSDAASEGDADDEDDLIAVLARSTFPINDAAKLTLSQLTCLYQFAFVMGMSVM